MEKYFYGNLAAQIMRVIAKTRIFAPLNVKTP